MVATCFVIDLPDLGGAEEAARDERAGALAGVVRRALRARARPVSAGASCTASGTRRHKSASSLDSAASRGRCRNVVRQHLGRSVRKSRRRGPRGSTRWAVSATSVDIAQMWRSWRGDDAGRSSSAARTSAGSIAAGTPATGRAEYHAAAPLPQATATTIQRETIGSIAIQPVADRPTTAT